MKPAISTDPGLGSPQAKEELMRTQPMMPVPPKPLNIVVPASAPVEPKKDSVELLLDGMSGQQADRPKTLPQTDGEASASYHTQHEVRPARTSPDPEPKVVVERSPLQTTQRVHRDAVREALERAEADARSVDATLVVPKQVMPRVVVAIVAGLVVVLGLFVVARWAATRAAGAEGTASGPAVATVSPRAASMASPPAIASAAPQPVLATAPTAASEHGRAPAPAAALASATASSPAPTPASVTVASSASIPPGAKPKGRPMAAAAATAPSHDDLGEFKTTFH